MSQNNPQPRREPPRRLALAIVAAAALCGNTGARGEASPATAPATHPPQPVASLIITLTTTPAGRPALRDDLGAAQVQRLRSWREKGVITGWRLLFNRFADAGSWDALEILTFNDTAAMARWNEIERSAPAGLDSRALALVTSISSAPSDLVRHETAPDPGRPHGPFLVIPYDALVPIPEYLRYVDGYTLPQAKGWMHDGALRGYGLHIARYYAGRPWTAMLLLDYRGDAGLARREEVVAATRSRLAADPDWKAFSDNKKAIRAEKQLAVADELASEGADQ